MEKIDTDCKRQTLKMQVNLFKMRKPCLIGFKMCEKPVN